MWEVGRGCILGVDDKLRWEVGKPRVKGSGHGGGVSAQLRYGAGLLVVTGR